MLAIIWLPHSKVIAAAYSLWLSVFERRQRRISKWFPFGGSEGVYNCIAYSRLVPFVNWMMSVYTQNTLQNWWYEVQLLYLPFEILDLNFKICPHPSMNVWSMNLEPLRTSWIRNTWSVLLSKVVLRQTYLALWFVPHSPTKCHELNNQFLVFSRSQLYSQYTFPVNMPQAPLEIVFISFYTTLYS